jgi:hypothetical protein
VNNFTTSSAPTTPTVPGTAGSAATAAPGAGGVTPASPVTPVAPGGSGVTGLTGSAPGAGGSTGPPTIVGKLGVVPTGAPRTGIGGASHSRDNDLVFAGALALIGAGLASTVAIRRRRSFSVRGANETP